MSRYIGPKGRLCRREGMNLFDRPKYAKILEKRPGRPGPHQDSAQKPSEYSAQMREKQKLRFMFGLTDGQLKTLVKASVKKKGLTMDNIMRRLEMRLDNVIYRAGFALNRIQARQMATHGHFLLNGSRTDVPSMKLDVGDKLELRPKLKSSALYPAVFEENKGYKPSRWLKTNPSNFQIEVAGDPTAEDFEKLVDVQKIVEFYSR